MFSISCLAWLDALRGFSGAEKIAYSDSVRRCILDAHDGSLETLVGCPSEIFFEIGKVLTAGKEHFNGTLAMEDFQPILDASEAYLRSWSPELASFPTPDPEWRLLADAYRHASILRVLRFPEPLKSCPPEEPVIKESVAAILDVAARIPMDSPFYKRLLFPLFLAGAETTSPHQYHYVQLCISEIKRSTGFQHQAMTDLLKKVWEVRPKNPEGWRNVSWTEWEQLALARTLNHVPWSEQYERMISGMLYDSFVPELSSARFKARAWCHNYNNHFPVETSPDFESLQKHRLGLLYNVLGHVEGDEAFIEPPFFVDYGCNIRLGARFYANFNLTILDCGIVTIGDRVMFGPNVSICAATHETEVQSRRDNIDEGGEKGDAGAETVKRGERLGLEAGMM
ncbi:putative galactoside o-acetyltransferase [Diplodia seriata]|uniref:Putative galactoside o-acetyltransferase n=1 Tax=Diplodia seriata TaxID=420778 RepID=A0A0G2EGN1_9PEZI|nr:putative galactoside o-acetyltransferase [Diplodia seriata]